MAQNKFIALGLCAAFFALALTSLSFAQDKELEVTLDASAHGVPFPKLFRPNIDLSGRGFHSDATWPQTLAAQEALTRWEKDIGFNGIYRLQYNLWEIGELSKNQNAKNALLAHYESLIKKVSDSGGVVILNLFGTPAGLGKVLDKKSPPRDLKAFKQLVKNTIRTLSYTKRYNVWYEVWNAPDLDDFFLGRTQEYLFLYRAVAESVNEIETETKLHIPLGAPAVSWWFKNTEGNTIATPEKSLIYELIKFCYRYHLPLDFVSWHNYSTDPLVEKEATIYNKTSVQLIRDWLAYFHFDPSTPLIVDEWNYDRYTNVAPERGEKSYIAASYIPSHIKSMYEAGLTYQLYFSLEDFQDNKEGIVRNVGIFSYDSSGQQYKGGPKPLYNVFRMLSLLGGEMLSLKLDDPFTGLIYTKNQDEFSLLVYNYIDPELVMNYISKNIARLRGAERNLIIAMIKSGTFENVVNRQLEIRKVRATKKMREILKKAIEMQEKAKQAQAAAREIKLNFKNLKTAYVYERYSLDASSGANDEFRPVDSKEVQASAPFQVTLSLEPYSVHLVTLKKRPPEELASPGIKPEQELPAEETTAPEAQHSLTPSPGEKQEEAAPPPVDSQKAPSVEKENE